MALALDGAPIAVDRPGQGHPGWWPDHLYIPERAAGCALVLPRLVGSSAGGGRRHHPS